MFSVLVKVSYQCYDTNSMLDNINNLFMSRIIQYCTVIVVRITDSLVTFFVLSVLYFLIKHEGTTGLRCTSHYIY